MTDTNDYKGPLGGLNVLDFGWYYAGPMAGMLLADQGANVIRIVKPGEKELPDQQYRLLNRNKKLLELDLKTEEGKQQALSLIEKSDVLIENFRPGVMKRLGLDYASVKDKSPGMVYLSLPGFASTDKERAHIQAWEGVLAAAAGLFSKSITVREMLGFPPLYMPMPQCSAYGAIHGVVAIMAALLARENQGMGTVLEVPLVDAGLSGATANFLFDPLDKHPSEQAPPALKSLRYHPEDSADAQLEKLRDARDVMFPSLYPCGDGGWLFHWGGRDFWGFCKILGIDKTLRREGFMMDAWESGLDNNIGSREELSPERAKRFRQLMEDALRQRPAEEWVSLLGNKHLIAKVRSRSEWLSLEPMLTSGVLATMDDGHSVLTVPGRAVDVAGPEPRQNPVFHEPEAIDFQQANRLFQKAASQVWEAGADKRKPLRKGELLQGLKVLDLANIMAGPTAAYTLAQYGADIIKIDAPDSIRLPHLLSVILEGNQGKRSLLVNLHTVPGQALFNKLLKQSDVVMHNILDDTAQRIGVTHHQLQAVNAKLVSCQLSCFGGTHRGGWETRLGIDYTAQAATGLMAQLGSIESPQWNARADCADIITGIALAFSALLGIYQYRKTGYAGECRTSLVRMCNYYQLPYMIAEDGCSDWGEAHGPLSLGKSWHQRIYRCRDGWIYVEAHNQHTEALAELVAGEQADQQALEDRFSEGDCDAWLQKLASINVPCHKVLDMRDLAKNARPVDNRAADETARACGEVLTQADHPCGKPITLKAPDWVRVGENHSYHRLGVAPRYGQHTREILQELGYTEDMVDELIRIGAVYEYLPVLQKDRYFI